MKQQLYLSYRAPRDIQSWQMELFYVLLHFSTDHGMYQIPKDDTSPRSLSRTKDILAMQRSGPPRLSHTHNQIGWRNLCSTVAAAETSEDVDKLTGAAVIPIDRRNKG